MSQIEKVKELRRITGAGFKDCNSALKETIISAKKSAPIDDSKKSVDKIEEKESTKTVQEVDREKLDKKFLEKKKKKLN